MREDEVLMMGAPLPVKYVPRNETGRESTPQTTDPLHHALAAGRIPYLPTSALLETPEHPDYVARELFRRFLFLAQVVAGLDHRDVVALRIFNHLQRPDHQPRLELWLFVKSARPTEIEAREAAGVLWEVIRYAFPNEAPFGYPVLRATADEIGKTQHRIAGRLHTGVDFRKHWDVGVSPMDAFPHPYRSAPALHALPPLFATLAASKRRYILSVSLRPSGLLDLGGASRLLEEFRTVQLSTVDYRVAGIEAAREFDAKLQGVTTSREALERGRQARAFRQPEDLRLRGEMGAQAIESLLRNRGRLLSMRVILAGFSDERSVHLEQAVCAALSSQAVDDPQRTAGHYLPPEAVFASTKERVEEFGDWARDLLWLEQTPPADPREQWRYLVIPEEAITLFSLPMPAEFGQVPGIVNRTEPFGVPVEETESGATSQQREPGLSLGEVYDRGTPTGEDVYLPLSKLDQHVLIAGRSGSGKTNTCLHLLRQLTQHDIDFLVLDPLDKRDYRLLLGDEALRPRLRIYTLGREESPFVFNPFAVPPGVTVRQHISQLLRCFLTAFVVGDPIPAIYRAALRKTYERHLDKPGDETAQLRSMPTFEEFFQTLERVAVERSRDYSKDIQGNIRQMTRLRIGSLLEDNARIFNVDSDPEHPHAPFPELVENPAVIELGYIGSDEDKALIMAFLLTSLMPHIRNRSQRDKPHVILIEEAHRLMRRGGSVSDLRGDATQQARGDFSNLLAEVRGYNQGILVVDQSPAELVPAVFANTATHVMHQLRDPQSFEMMASTFVLSPPQASYAQRLERGHAITETAQGTPVHVKLPPVADKLRSALRDLSLPNGKPWLDPKLGNQVGDEAVGVVMRDHDTQMPVGRPVLDYETLLNRDHLVPPSAKAAGVWFEEAPYRSCFMCRSLWAQQKCVYGGIVGARRLNGKLIAEEAKSDDLIARCGDTDLWSKLRVLADEVAAICEKPEEARDVLYCHLAMACAFKSPADKETADGYRRVLGKFQSRYGA